MSYYVELKCGAFYQFMDYKELIIKDGIVFLQAQFKTRGRFNSITLRLRTIDKTNVEEIKTEMIKG